MSNHISTQELSDSLSRRAQIGVSLAAFSAWFFGGMQILLTNLGMRAASLDLMGRQGMLDFGSFTDLNRRAGELVGSELAQLNAWNTMASQWYAWFQCAFLFGAAVGGYLFGKLGDRYGRTKLLGISILWFAGFTGSRLVCSKSAPTPFPQVSRMSGDWRSLAKWCCTCFRGVAQQVSTSIGKRHRHGGESRDLCHVFHGCHPCCYPRLLALGDAGKYGSSPAWAGRSFIASRITRLEEAIISGNWNVIRMFSLCFQGRTFEMCFHWHRFSHYSAYWGMGQCQLDDAMGR
jgi:hypothetical protein